VPDWRFPAHTRVLCARLAITGKEDFKIDDIHGVREGLIFDLVRINTKYSIELLSFST
jgi:hypothetical protein